MTIDKYLSQANRQKTTRSTLRQLGSLLSVMVILGVFWGLKLTGITMAGEAFCGMEEHTHSEACQVQELICTQEETPSHTHSAECLEQLLVCTEEAVEGHTHGEACTSKTLTCAISEEAAHSHDAACYVKTPGCGLEETEIARTVAYTIGCGLEETESHTHGDGCYTAVVDCGRKESEGHTHSDGCMEVGLSCEEDHTHDDSCYTLIAACGKQESEGHTHDDSCMGTALSCTRAETKGHTHADACYVAVLSDESEGHRHDESCMVSTLACGRAETEGHAHTDGCYAIENICTQEEIAGHTHGEGCYVPGTEYACGLEETEGHTHAQECYTITESCPVEEHIHTASCYSDISADLETSDDWEMSLAELTRSPSTAENILSVAQSQLGMAESTRNFQVDEAGIRRGITRYGQWYGNPYGDWSAMFACFCLEYAGVADVPTNVGAETMRLGWEAEELYAAAGDEEPVIGQLLFLDKDGNGKADAVAIITDIQEDVIFAIEGDLGMQVTRIGEVELPAEDIVEAEEDPEAETEEAEPVEIPEGYTVNTFAADRVARTLYAADDPAIMGYGLVPFDPGLSLMAVGDRRVIWLDGTNGGLMALGDSPNTRYYATEGGTFTLPEQWQSPSKYDYTLRGWYDVVNSKYYAPGATVQVGARDLVFYADWVASSYDIGRYNSHVDTQTISTNDFITTRMFDYSILFNVMSSTASVTVNESGHSEVWTLLTSGRNPYNNQTTLDYIFRDWDRGDIDISYPRNTNQHNTYDAAIRYHAGLYTDQLVDLLFATDNSFDPETGEGVIGKEYLGTADYLFQLCTNPAHDHYGYYYYDSERNAAAYNQSDQRFYVYDYLERTTDSIDATDEHGLSDFLPLNSPYVNTNGRTPATYTADGVEGEHVGTTHYQYEAKEGSSPVGVNYLFGMSIDINFYIPNRPGTMGEDGYGNRDIYGKDMHFKFSGDDDVWVFVDDTMVLDLGGIHGIESGDVNFSTGIVTVDGSVNNALSQALQSIPAGDHTLTIYYLERGSSQSNCAIYFNLAPRFSFSIQKEDVLTREILNGAQFSVFTDAACTQPAELWTSEAAHKRGDAATNVFTVTDGVADMWGMGAGNTYYIKETRAPDKEGYGLSRGIIKVKLDNTGSASYSVEMMPEIVEGEEVITGGFTVYGFRIDAETQQAYIIVTNAPEWAQETTQVHARKLWADGADHSGESVTVYLTTTDPNGTVRRLQEATLSDDNNWYYMWDNLPKYREDHTEVVYGVEEAYVSGYYSKVEQVENYNITQTTWSAVNSFENGKTYILRSSQGYLSTLSNASDTGFAWVDETIAKGSAQAQWKATVSGSTVRLTNGLNQTLTFYYNGGSSGYPTDFFASTGGETDASKQYFRYRTASGGLRLYYDGADGRDYYMGSLNDSQKFQYTTTEGSGLILTPMTQTTTTIVGEVTGVAYLITNTPLDQETSVTVRKYWDYGNLEAGTLHEQAQVTVRLLANGKNTGRTVTLSLKNNWKGTFQGLPYMDGDGNVIVYTIEETWDNELWLPQYGTVVASGDAEPVYSTMLTNRYVPGIGGPELPSTGTAARLLFVLLGGGVMLAALVAGIGIRYRRERRQRSAF